MSQSAGERDLELADRIERQASRAESCLDQADIPFLPPARRAELLQRAEIHAALAQALAMNRMIRWNAELQEHDPDD